MLSTQNGRAWTLFTVIEPTSGAWLAQLPARDLSLEKLRRVRERFILAHKGARVYVHQRRRISDEWELVGYQQRLVAMQERK